MVEKETISVREVAQYLGVNPQSIRKQAREDASKLNFKCSVIGCHVVIPKEPFFEFLRGEKNEQMVVE